MDKNSLGQYGWLVICILILAIMITLATPFGSVIRSGVENAVGDFKGVATTALDNIGGETEFGGGGSGGSGGSGEGSGGGGGEGSVETLSTPSVEINGDELTITMPSGEAEFFEVFVNGTSVGTVTSAGTTTTYDLAGKVSDGDTVGVVAKTSGGEVSAEVEAVYGTATLVAGLYQTGTTTRIYTWDELISNGTLNSYGYIVSGKESELAGDLIIPDGRTSIGESEFYRCSSLTGVTIPDSVKTIAGMAFYYCAGLTTITIPDGVTNIGPNAFQGCDNLESVYIPNTIEKIDYYAFGACGLADMYYSGTKAQWNAIELISDWNGDTNNFAVHCTDGDLLNGINAPTLSISDNSLYVTMPSGDEATDFAIYVNGTLLETTSSTVYSLAGKAENGDTIGVKAKLSNKYSDMAEITCEGLVLPAYTVTNMYPSDGYTYVSVDAEGVITFDFTPLANGNTCSVEMIYMDSNGNPGEMLYGDVDGIFTTNYQGDGDYALQFWLPDDETTYGVSATITKN